MGTQKIGGLPDAIRAISGNVTGEGGVIVVPGNVELQEKTITPTLTQQIVEPDENYDALSKVTVEGVSVQEKTVTPSGSQQVITPDSPNLGLSKVTVNATTLQEKTVTPTTSQQVITPDSGNYGLSKVIVNAAAAAAAPKLEEKTVTLMSTSQILTPSTGYDGFSKVTIPGAALQSKSVTPSASSQTIKPDSSYYGLSQVSVGAIPANFVNTSDATATAADIKSGKTAYIGGSKVTGSMVMPGTLTLTVNCGTSIAGTFRLWYIDARTFTEERIIVTASKSTQTIYTCVNSHIVIEPDSPADDLKSIWKIRLDAISNNKYRMHAYLSLQNGGHTASEPGQTLSGGLSGGSPLYFSSFVFSPLLTSLDSISATITLDP